MNDPAEQEADRDVDEQLAKIGTEFGGSFDPPPEVFAPPPEVPDQEDLKSVAGESNYVDERRRLELEDFRHEIGARKHYGRWAFILMTVWLALVLLTVWMSWATVQSPHWYPDWLPSVTRFKVSDGVLMALFGSATANIIALLVIVFNYLYPSRK